MENTYDKISAFFASFQEFLFEFANFTAKRLHFSFIKFEKGKGAFVSALYKQRGRRARGLVHTGMASLAAFGMVLAPVVAQEFPGTNVNPWEIPTGSLVLSAADSVDYTTVVSDKVRDRVIEYEVQEGDTLSSIASKFDVSLETVLWQNNLTATSKIKQGDVLDILPITGISHKVNKGDTVYSIAKRYDVDPQAVVNFPFNTYVNDETFDLAIGQTVVVPEGIKPTEVRTTPRIRNTTPDAGTVVASGQFVWPASGSISQPFVWYHTGLDIANRGLPNVLAADSGTVVTSGWSSYGYGNHVVIDHGNGYRTLYAHLSSIYVNSGQTIGRGSALGRMGSTGRSTGPHLHFEVIRNGVYLNPLSVLQ
jgi:LysM repeat protein